MCWGRARTMSGPLMFCCGVRNGDLAQKFGAQMRFHSSLPKSSMICDPHDGALLELAFEWYAHHRYALQRA